MRHKLLALMALLCVSNSGALGMSHPDVDKLSTNLRTALSDSLDLSSEAVNKDPGAFYFKVDLDKGNIYDFRWLTEPKSAQTKADILDSLFSIEPISIPTTIRGNGFTEFELSTDRNQTNLRINTGRSKGKKSAKGAVILYSIPLSVMKKYPGIFTYSELTDKVHQKQFASKNLSAERVKRLREPWVQFFSKHENCSKEELLRLEKEADSQWLSAK
jgi:hypothetical protein